MVRVQVLMGEREREEFRKLADRSGMSLSAWLRHAGLERASRQKEKTQLDSREALREFFTRCDDREQGVEPDWREHQQVIETSKRSGDSGT